jgi:opacity protein-like surface antigen
MAYWLRIFVLASLALTGTLGQTQAQEWKYGASIYLFVAETETGLGDRSATLSFSDALDNLDVAFMGAFEANNGQWGVLLDYMRTDISFRNTFSGPAAATLDTSVKTQILTGYLSYRLYDTGSVKTDALAGFRYFDTETRLTLTPGGTRSLSDSWTDPVIGVRSLIRWTDKWSGTFLADYGGLNDRENWQILLTANYAITENWTARFGYRHIDISNDEGATNYSFRQSGPIAGVVYRF